MSCNSPHSHCSTSFASKPSFYFCVFPPLFWFLFWLSFLCACQALQGHASRSCTLLLMHWKCYCPNVVLSCWFASTRNIFLLIMQNGIQNYRLCCSSIQNGRQFFQVYQGCGPLLLCLHHLSHGLGGNAGHRYQHRPSLSRTTDTQIRPLAIGFNLDPSCLRATMILAWVEWSSWKPGLTSSAPIQAQFQGFVLVLDQQLYRLWPAGVD